MQLDDDARRERRRHQRRRIRRRRLIAFGGLSLALVAIVAAIVLVTGSNDSEQTPADGREQSGSTGTSGAEADTRDRAERSGSRARATQARAAGSVASTRVGHDEPVPILMYHQIDTAPAGAPLPALYVPPADFSSQLQELRRRGYHGVTLDQVYQRWHGGPALPRKPIVVSFDDGDRSWRREALPVMRKLGWPGVANVQVDLLGSEKLPKGDVRDLIAAGWEVDSHTFSHADLSALGGEQLERELAGSREDLRKRLRVPVNYICYPAGKFNPAVIEAARRAGYRGGTTTIPGNATPGAPFELKRIRINGGADAADVAELVEANG